MAAAKVFALAALAAVARAHVVISLPVPFDQANLNNSPLDPSGSDFPCKAPNYSNVGTLNEYTIGGKGQLQFLGTAVHGGGSCQVSITYDNPPTKDSTWKVIKSFEGGCPARNAAGNLDGNSAELPNPDTYDFDIPAIPDGEAILAWTWFNKVGNREMYMNCAPIKLTGTGSADNYNNLPDMFRANIADTTCATAADTDLLFPDPGNVVELGNGATSAFATPDSCTSTSGTHPDPSSVPDGGSGDAPATTTAAEEAPATTTMAAPETTKAADSGPTSVVPGGVFVTTPAGGNGDSSEGEDATPATSTAKSTPTKAPTTGSGDSGSSDPAPSGSDSVLTGKCTTEGQFNCIAGTQYQQCASGTWSVAQPVAPGTACTVKASGFAIQAVAI